MITNWISAIRQILVIVAIELRDVDGGCALFEFLLDDRASHDTNLKFSSVVPQVSIFRYFGKLNDGFDRPHERC